MEPRPQAISQGVEQTIMYIQRALSFIPGVVYSQQFATPEDRLRAICEAVQNDAVLLQQAQIKIEQQDMTILQAERDQARIEMQQVKREVESYKKNMTAPPAQIYHFPRLPLQTAPANMAEKLMEAKAEVTDVASEIEMLKSTIKNIKEHQSKAKAALKVKRNKLRDLERCEGGRVLDLSLRLEELEKQSLDMRVELHTKDQKSKQVLEGNTRETEGMVRAKDQMRTFLQVVQSRADQLLDAIDMARTMMDHQDPIMKEWHDRTEASESRVKELDTELEESKGLSGCVI
ncbi:hypothetical protein BG006_009836 [Podila minutissima]|uniref:Uncharacterized protein n=1 Tax=Podila minutissima TaxID=64525 RepID=A0A9P5SG85_9FUNG|nr:hypothetical protein BG006_009836 [Podila minutissima]